jgi:hypothetical protein
MVFYLALVYVGWSIGAFWWGYYGCKFIHYGLTKLIKNKKENNNKLL